MASDQARGMSGRSDSPGAGHEIVNVELTGAVLPGFKREAVLQALAELLGVSPARVERLLVGKKATIRRGVPFDEAIRYLSILKQAGAESYMVAVTRVPRSGVASVTTGMQVRTDQTAPLQNANTEHDAGWLNLKQTPALFGFDAAGRMGRIRFMAFNLLALLVLLLPVAWVSDHWAGLSALMIGVAVMPMGLLGVWVVLRYQIMRLHDIDLSGKWLLLPILLIFAYSIASGGWMDATIQIFVGILNLLMFLFLLVWPGSKEKNRYGPPCASNSLLVKAGAILAVLLVLVQPVAIPAFQQLWLHWAGR